MFKGPIPAIDGPTLFVVLAASLLFALAGLADFNLSAYVPGVVADFIYVFAAVSAVWQILRQR